MGLEHGIYCLGSNWLLFVLLFPLGIMNIAVMAVLTVLIFAETFFMNSLSLELRTMFRTTPLGYMPDGERLVIFAANGGSPTNPDWYHNLGVHPQVTVEVGTQTFDAIAVDTEDTEWDRLWTQGVALYPSLAEHQAKTTRQIPVIELSRQES